MFYRSRGALDQKTHSSVLDIFFESCIESLFGSVKRKKELINKKKAALRSLDTTTDNMYNVFLIYVIQNKVSLNVDMPRKIAIEN